MWRLAAISLSLLGCAEQDDELDCGPNATAYDCGGADDWWHPPTYTSNAHLDEDTLVCVRYEWLTACNNAPPACCCGGVIIRSQSAAVDPAQCATACTGLDEATCLNAADCFVARESGTNAYLGCYGARPDVYTSACAMHSSAESCTRGTSCVPLYTSTGTGTWQFSACTEE
jgi:hypothetical protein